MSKVKNKKGMVLFGSLGLALLVLMMVFSSGKQVSEDKTGAVNDATNGTDVSGKEVSLSAKKLLTENEKLQTEIENVQHEIEKLKEVDANSDLGEKESGAR